MKYFQRKLTIWSACLLLVPLAAAENLLLNPGFENQTEHWGVREWSTPAGRVELHSVTTNAHGGERCAEVRHIAGGDNILLRQQIAIDGARELRLTFYAKSDLRASSDTGISAAFVTLDKNGKKLQYKVQRFTSSDQWKMFEWNFTTAPGTARLELYLRNDRTTTWYDDVELTEFSGVAVSEACVWYPEREFIAKLAPSFPIAEYPATVRLTLADESGKTVAETVCPLSKVKFPAVAIAYPAAVPGRYCLTVECGKYRSTARLEFPASSPETPHRKNNFVTELPLTNAPEGGLAFENPRAGWVRLAAVDGLSSLLSLDGETLLGTDGTARPTESMRFLDKGRHHLQIEGSPAKIRVSTMPEIILCEYESKAANRNHRAMIPDDVLEDMLGVCNVVMENFENSDRMSLEKIEPAAAERIRRWRAAGRRTIANVWRPGLNKKLDASESFPYWSSRRGLTEYDGIAIDEFAKETVEQAAQYENAVQQIFSDARLRKKSLYAYCCAAWYSHRRTDRLRDALAAGNGVFAVELYLREQPDEPSAKLRINAYADYLRQWEKHAPGSLARSIFVMSCTDGRPGYYGQDTFASADYRYFLDLQFNLLANDPAFTDLRGVSAWILRYCAPDTARFLSRLYRHYCIEGERGMLSARYGFSATLDYLRNPDFADGLAGWEALPAAPESISVKSIEGWGFGRGVCNTKPDGDRFVLLRRVPGKVNIVRQKLTGLKPGRRYEVTLRVADYEDITAGRETLKQLPLNVTVENARMIPAESFTEVYVSAHAMPPRFSGKTSAKPCANYLRVVFVATGPEAVLQISDEAGLPYRVFERNQAKFSSVADLHTPALMFNFVQVQPLLGEPKQ